MGAKRVLITAGVVYGKLDDNKLVGNRVRGVWASRLAGWLGRQGYRVTLVVADSQYHQTAAWLPEEPKVVVVQHNGFWDYQEICTTLAKDHDAAVMAAAVVNWIPETPFPGKMVTAGYRPGDRIQVPFVLAPHVIDQMKQINPQLTLVGCKMTISAPHDHLIDLAYQTLLRARCNVVVANDMGVSLRRKYLVFPDRSVHPHNIKDDAESFYGAIRDVIDAQFYRTEVMPRVEPDDWTKMRFNMLVDHWRSHFIRRSLDGDMVLGSVAVRTSDWDEPDKHETYLVSPREKGQSFKASDAVIVKVDTTRHVVQAYGGKATLNAPLLVRMLRKHAGTGQAMGVVHVHKKLVNERCSTVPHAPPGSWADNDRELPGPVFNIQNHGLVGMVGFNGTLFEYVDGPRYQECLEPELAEWPC